MLNEIESKFLKAKAVTAPRVVNAAVAWDNRMFSASVFSTSHWNHHLFNTNRYAKHEPIAKYHVFYARF